MICGTPISGNLHMKTNKDQWRLEKDAAVASSFSAVMRHDHIYGIEIVVACHKHHYSTFDESYSLIWFDLVSVSRRGAGSPMLPWWQVTLVTRVQSVQRISLSRWVSRDQLVGFFLNIPRESATMIHHDPPTLTWKKCWKRIACNLRCCSCRWKRSQMPCLHVQAVLATVDSITGSFFHVEMHSFGDHWNRRK